MARPFISFTTRSPAMKVVALPGEGSPSVTDGYGQIETITRPQRKGLTRWTGSNPLGLSIPILLDGFRSERNIEPECADLERMAGIDGTQPDVVIDSTGDVLVPHAAEHKWLITGIEWGDALRSPNGRRVRQAATITVIAKTVATTEKSIAKRNAPSAKHATSYKVKSGDTLRSIARKVLHDADRWIEIRTLNGIADPRIVGQPGKRKGNVGTTLKMPKG